MKKLSFFTRNDKLFIDVLFARVLFGDGYITAPLLVTPVLIFSLSTMLVFYESNMLSLGCCKFSYIL